MSTTRKALYHDRANRPDIEAIRAALIEGEESGEPQAFDSEKFKLEMVEKHTNKAR